MAKEDISLHDVKDKPRILVDKDSAAAKLVNPKFINKQGSNRIRTGAVIVGDEPEFPEDPEYPGEYALQAPEFTDIYIKYNNAFENVDPTHKYGKLIKQGDNVSVELEFKIMIPVDLEDIVTGVEILSEDEVIATI